MPTRRGAIRSSAQVPAPLWPWRVCTGLRPGAMLRSGMARQGMRLASFSWQMQDSVRSAFHSPSGISLVT